MSFKPVHGTGCGRMAKLRAGIAAADEGQTAGRPLRAALLSATMLAGAASLALMTPQQALAQQVYDDVDLENDGGDMNFAGDLVIAQSGTTTFAIFNAGTVNNTNGTIGLSAGSNGTVTVTGADSTWTNSQALRIGDLGTGTLTISDGGRVNSASGFAAFRSGSTGAVTVTGAGSLWNNPGEIRIGGLGAGTLTILDGGSVHSGVAYVAHESGSSAVVTVSGAGSEWISTNFLRIGGSGSANMTISDGGLVQNTRGEIGVGTPVVSSVLVTGTDSRWINTDELRIGVFGTGTLSIADGGAVSAANVTLANNASATGTLNFGAAAGNAAAAAGTLDTPTINFGAGTGTIVFNHTNTDFELDADISGNGTIRLLSGRTILSGNSTYTGNTFLEGGTLTLGSSNALGGSTLTTTGSVVDYADGVNIANAVVIDSDTTQFQVLAGSATQSGVISENNGPRPFEKIGDGELILTAANTWTGETTVTNGTLTFDGGSVALAANRNLFVGRDNGDDGTLIIRNGGAVSNTLGTIGANAGSTGEVTVTGAGSSWANSFILVVGNAGNAALTVADGGAVSNTEGRIGGGANSTGTVTVTGAGSNWTNTAQLLVGVSGSGALTIADCGAVSNTEGRIGNSTGSTGEVTVTGVGSTWTNDGFLDVGRSGDGTLTISNGGAVSNDFGTIGTLAGSTGEVTVTGAGSTWTNTGQLSVGEAGGGALTIADGGAVSSGAGWVGTSAGSTGVATITGAGSSWTMVGLHVGNSGNGTLIIENGGSASSTFGYIGNFGGATGNVTVTGEDSIWTSTNSLRFGQSGGNGTLTIADGGEVRTGSVILGETAAATGTLNIGAAAGDAAVAAGTLDAPALTFGAGAGTIVFNHTASGAGHSFASDITGGGAGNSLIRQLAGLTRLTGANAGYGGAFTVEGGTLFVDSALGGAGGTVMSGGTLSGSGSISSLVTVNAGGILAGSSGMTLGFDDLVLGNGAVINVALGAPGGPELFAVGGDLTLDGTLNVSDAGGFGIGLYSLFSYGGALTDNGLALGSLPSGLNAGDQTIQTSVAGQVNLLTAFPASAPTEFALWDGDGAGNANNGRVDGGDGVWSRTSQNWTTAAGDVNGAMSPVPGFAIFTGAAGTVTADESEGDLSALGMQFAVDGYELTGDRIELVANAGASLLRVGNGGAAGAGMTATIRNNLYGNTDFVLSDLGRLVLTGSNSWTGETQVRSGTLRLDGGSITHAGSDLRVGAGNGGNAALVIANGGALSNRAGHVGESAGSAGAVTVTGAGSLWTNAASLGVGMSGTGTLTIADGGRVSATGVTLAQNAASTGTLTIGAAAGSGAQAAGTLDSATLEFGEGMGRLVFNHTAAGGGYAFSANISSNAGGDALIRQLSGFTRLTGNSAGYQGNLDVGGGTLSVDGVLGSGGVTASVSNGGTLTGSGTLDGDVAIGAGAILAGQSGQTFTIGGNLTLAGDALVNVALGAPGGAELFAVGGDLTLDGTLNISDAAGFGPGLYALFSYGGTLTDNGLAIGTTPFSGILPGGLQIQTSIAGSVNLVSNIDVDLLFWDGGDPANAANGRIDGGDGVWSANSLTFTDIGGLVSRPSGPAPGFLVFAAAAGNVTVDGSAGEIAIEGAQFAVDGYVIDGDAITLAGDEAILRVGNGTATGAGFTARIGSALVGDAALVKTDFGTLILTGANSYTGGTQVREGTLIGSTASIMGNIANEGVVVFNQAGDATLSQTLSGDGVFRFTGGAQFTLGASNSHAGGTHVTGSGLVLTASDSAGTGAITLQDASLAFAGGIEVSNGLAVSGTNSLHVGSGTASYGGELSGSGAFTLGGPGTLVFAGNGSAFAGQTTITGNVLMNGSLGGTVEVGDGGILRGFGTLGSTRLLAGSTIAPGNSVGTLTINGNLVFETGSLYEATALPNGESDLIQVTGGITINGGSVLLVGSDSGFSANTGYTILTAGGGITGQFDSVSSNFSFLTPNLVISGNSLTLNLVRNDVEFAQFATSPNQTSASHAADSLGAGNPLWETLVLLDSASATDAFEALQGEIHATHRQLVMDDTLHARRAVSSRLAAARGDDARSAWISGHSGGAQLGSRGGLSRTSSDSSGVMLGLDAPAHERARIGVMAAFSETGFSLAGRNAAGTAESRSLGVYGGTQLGALTVSAGAIHGWHDMTTSRAVSFPGVDEQIRSGYSADSVQLFGEVSLAGPAGFEPFVSLAHVRLDTGDFSEVGGISALTIDSGTRQMTQGTLGSRFGHDWQTGGANVRLEGSLGWRRVFSGERQFVSGDLSGAPVFFEGNGVDRDAAAVEAGITIEPAGRMSLSLGYAGEIGSNARNHGAQFRMALTF